MAVDAQHQLQPALLDRLTDDHRNDSAGTDDQRVIGKAVLRRAVLRDLGTLFNATQPLRQAIEAHPVLAGSVLNYGLPATSGQLASEIDAGSLEAVIREAIVRFEPRILADSLRVKAIEPDSLLDTHNVVEFEIRGQLWSKPAPIDIVWRTRLNLEAGQIDVSDATSAPLSSSAARTGPRPQLGG